MLSFLGNYKRWVTLKPLQGDDGSQELVFLEERCEDDKALRDYGINSDFIVQVFHYAPWTGTMAQ